MNSSRKALLVPALLLIALVQSVKAQDFSLSAKDKPLMILYNKAGQQLDSLCAHLLAADIEKATGRLPGVITNVSEAKGEVMVIGNIQSALVQQFTGKQSSLTKNVKGWERFGLKVVEHPLKNITQALVIAGSDARGTAYGVFAISEKIGVSPWYWWADVPVNKQSKLTIHQPEFISAGPSVKYRGIFINDEDWGLRPWSAGTFDPELKNIGPKTYAKVFELLLRLKANFIWPAMHPGTDAFYTVKGNKEMAALYHIVIGSSHAEPMLRNNVGEWNEKTMGAFNYFTNKTKIENYWEERVKESSDNNVIYTMGMRGVHDGQMEGIKSVKEAVPALEQIIKQQRELLQKYQHKNLVDIPQVFTPYKEVLEFYDNGLKVPDDITLVWPDDNYGYIQRLSNADEQKRKGGAGVYYHASYWGRPHDYLWLSTMHPSLMREEMMKAYQTGADRLWVLNVGDIKPAEYDMQLFLDMAYNTTPFKQSSYTQKHLQQWNGQLFGINGKAISNIMWQYYNLAFERRPEFMGWSQTEPTTRIALTAYNHFYYGDEAQRRIDRYTVLENEIKQLRNKTGANMADAFYQLVYYPVVGAVEMNKKFLYNDKAWLYGKQNRISAYNYVDSTKKAYQEIALATTAYNNLTGGKWKGMMDMHPRGLPVFDLPKSPSININKTGKWNIAPEGIDTIAINCLALPAFNNGVKQLHFVDVFLTDSITVDWKAEPSAAWIILSAKSGKLSPAQSQTRLWASIDWSKAPKAERLVGSITFTGAGKQYEVKISANRYVGLFSGFKENDGYVSIYAQHYSGLTNKTGAQWQLMDGLGRTGSSVATAVSPLPDVKLDTATIVNKASVLTYNFQIYQAAAKPQIVLYALPTLPLNKSYGVRCAFRVDDGPLQVVDFKANSTARTEEWKQNVLSNQAMRNVSYPPIMAGIHMLKIYAIDPGVVLDRMLIDLGGFKPAYSIIAETR